MLSENFSTFNIDINIFVAISNVLLIPAGFFSLTKIRDIRRFLYVYFSTVAIIWHFSFLTWNIDSNAVLFYYSEWSRSIFSGPLYNANHSAVVTLIIFIYYMLNIRDEKRNHNGKNFHTPAEFFRLAIFSGQAVMFLYYTIQADSSMVNAIVFVTAVFLLFFLLSPKRCQMIYLVSSVIFLGIGGAYVIALITLDPNGLPLSGFEPRQIIGREALNFIIERPVFGYGTGSEYLVLIGRSMTAIPELIFQSAHSYYLDFSLQYGVAGFALALTGTFIVPMSVWILRGREEKFMSSTAFLIWILWLILLLSALTDFALSIPSVSMVLCFLTGGIYRQFATEKFDYKNPRLKQ